MADYLRIAATLEERYTARFAELNALKELLLTEDVVAAAATATVARARSSTVEDRLLKSGEERAARQKARLAEVERNRAAQVSSSKRALGDAVWRAPALAARVDAYNKMVGKCLTAVSADVRLQGDEEEDY